MYNGLLDSSEAQALDIVRLLLQQYEIYQKLSTEEKIIVDGFQSSSLASDVNFVQVLSDTENTYVYTPNGSAVEVEEIDYVTEDAKLSLSSIAEIAAQYGVLSTISGPTTRYNCHSFAWYSQSFNSNYYWMDNPGAYYSDSSYVSSEAEENYILCYFVENFYYLPDGTCIGSSGIINSHSAIITDVGSSFNKYDTSTLDSITVTSKWGQCGLYSHKGDDCPYIENTSGYIKAEYENENGEIVTTYIYMVSEFSHIEIYRPRTNQSYTVSTTMDDLSISRTINAGGSIVDQYGMYELNVTGGGKFTITIQSDESLDNRLYDANMNRRTMLVSEASAGSYTYVATLSSGRYYLRTAYADLTNSGTISITIEPHTHIYNQWTYYSYATHIESCVCGAHGTTKKEHIVDRTQVVNNTAPCLLCGHLLDLRFDSSVVESIGGLKVSANGSYILPSGIIVLDPADIEAYFNGTLIFYSREELPETA